MTSRWFPRVLVIFSLMIAAPALAQAPSAQRFVPPGGPGPGLLFVSGQGGPANYVPIAKQFAAQGFHVSLIDGNDVFKPNNAGLPGFVAAIKALRKSPQTRNGKIGVVGASLGGGAALTYAARMPNDVAATVAFYPYTSFIKDPADFADKTRVATLILAAVKDTYKDCCKIDLARKLAAAGKTRAPQPLISLVEYSDAGHAFNHEGPGLRRADAADALARAVAHLKTGLAASP